MTRWIHTIKIDCGNGIIYTEDYMAAMNGMLILGCISHNGTTYLVIV